MDIIKKKIDVNTLKLTANVKEGDYVSVVENALLDYRKKMTLPGFRAGKVPMSLVKKKYELAIRVEEINKLLSSSIQTYISDQKMSILGNPLPIETKIDFLNETDYQFEFEIGLQPKIDLSSAEKLKSDYWLIKPEKKEIEEYTLSLQKRYGSVQSFDKIDQGDMLSVVLKELESDNNPKVDGVVSETSILVDKIEDKKIRNQFFKLKKSETIILDLHKTFVNEADVLSMLKISKEKFNQINSSFSCTIKDITRLIPAKINSELFKKVYPDQVIKNLKEFQAAIKTELIDRYVIESDRKFFNDSSQIFLDKIKIDFPEKFLKKWLKTNIKKQFTEEEFEKEYQNYLKYLSWQLIENTICIENNIKVTDDKLKDFAKKNVLQQMKNYGSVNLGDKEIDGIVTNILKNEKEAEKMMNEVILIELVAYFKSKMKVSKKSTTLNEFIKLANQQV
ncbi:MAG: hypothetical protein CMD23_00110 [Flavobacteriales bacterium]|nr:hypothetical protein [Flavobacteriales bacterium]|tara:strand:- start:449 stop:1798 length:1350 start_codon:yes stop_codon:yes gene_type:complete